jgi:hypothetical protein
MGRELKTGVWQGKVVGGTKFCVSMQTSKIQNRESRHPSPQPSPQPWAWSRRVRVGAREHRLRSRVEQAAAGVVPVNRN